VIGCVHWFENCQQDVDPEKDGEPVSRSLTNKMHSKTIFTGRSDIQGRIGPSLVVRPLEETTNGGRIVITAETEGSTKYE